MPVMDLQGKTVLCIDDDASTLRLRRLLLESNGFQVETATSGHDGVSAFQSSPIDAVVVDYSMPGMNGGAVSASIRHLKPRVPIVMLSGHASAAAVVSELVDAFVEKGEDPSVLLFRLESLIRLRSHSHPELEKPYVVFADSSRRYLDCSDGVCKLLGFSRMELLEKTIDDVSYRPENTPLLFQQYVKQGNMDGQYILRHKDGRPVFVEYSAHIFPDGCMAAVWVPIEDWKQLYLSAMLEFEPEKLKQNVEVAYTAVQERMRELTASRDSNAQEWQELEDALSGLNVLNRDLSPESEQRKARVG